MIGLIKKFLKKATAVKTAPDEFLFVPDADADDKDIIKKTRHELVIRGFSIKAAVK